MNRKWFVTFCQLILLYLTYAPIVLSDGELYFLDEVTVKAYGDTSDDEGQRQLVLDTVRTYSSQTHDILLKYESNRKYVLKMTDKNSRRVTEGNFEAYGVFIVILRLVGLTTDSSEADILLTFQDLSDAQSVYTRHKRPDVEWVPNFKLDALTALDHQLRRVDCLSHGNPAITINIIPDEYGNGTEHGRFTFYPSSVQLKPVAVMFITQFVTIKVANKPQHVALAVKVGNGAFYFGLIFPKPVEAQLFLRMLRDYDHIEENDNIEISDARLSDLFDGY